MAKPPSAPELGRRLAELEAELGDSVTFDGLTRDYRIFQRRRGHRHSTDDLLTAWYAVTHAPPKPPASLLDLGTGIGSVGLSVAWALQAATLTAIEVQAGSYRLFCENVRVNGLEPRVLGVHGDLRVATPPGPFDLVTGSPPYFDVKNAVVSPDPQRAAARFELCGDVGDYCRAAAGSLAPGGRFVFCFPTVQRARAERACKDAGLSLVASRDVIPKEGLAPLFSLFACCGPCDPARGAPALEAPFVVRAASGAHTAEMLAARALFGMGGHPGG